MKKYSVYVHIFPNGKLYIGCSCNPSKRWEGSGVKYKPNTNMFEDIMHYGWVNVKHEILVDNLSKEMAYEVESALILKYKTFDSKYGYNLSQGSVKGVKHISPKGIKNIRESMTGRVVSEESRKKMSVAKIGKAYHTQKHSEETKKLIGERRKGKSAKENHPMARAVYCVELDRTFPYAKLAEEITGVCRGHISQVCQGKRKTAGKMHWKYANEEKTSN